MRIVKIHAENVLPVRHFSVDRLNDVVVIAGPNGVGKSRFIAGLLQKFQSPDAYRPSSRNVLPCERGV